MTATPPHGFRTFLIVWATQSVSLIGTALTFFAVNIWLTQVLYPRPEQRPMLAMALSLNGLSFALPTVFGAPLAGAWADRHDRRRTMIAMNLAAAALSLGLVACMVAHVLTLPLLLAFMVAYCLCGAFHAASFDTSYAMLVPPALLPRANGMMQSMWALSTVLSPALAASLIALPALARTHAWPGAGVALARLADGTPLALTVDAASFLFGALVLLAVRIPSPRRTDLGDDGRPRATLWADVHVGALYIWHRRPMLWLLGTFAAVNLLSAPTAVLQPLLVKFDLVRDWLPRGFTFESALALLASAMGLGGVTGGVIVSVWGGLKVRRVRGVLWPLLLGGLAETAYGASPLLFLSAAMVFVAGAMVPILNAHSQAIWQTQTPPELQGRVFSVRRLVAQFTFPLGTVIGGWLGAAVDPGVAIAVLGGAVTVFAVAQLFNPVLRQVEDKVSLDAMADRARAARVVAGA